MQRDALLEMLCNTSGTLFAVVDAARFDALQDRLARTELDFDPLYLDEIDAPTIASGPHLVSIRGSDDIGTLLRLIGNELGCVWWAWPPSSTAKEEIYRHLRSVNMVEIPTDRVDQDDQVPSQATYEAVLFRHGDPNVMMATLPLLYAHQIARLFGRAEAIIVDAPDYAEPRVFQSPEGLPAPSPGMLRIEGQQYDALADLNSENSRQTAMDGLRECYPEFTRQLDDGALRQIVFDAEQSGIEVGILSEKAHFYWACMYLLTKGDIREGVPKLAQDFSNLDISADAAVEAMFVEFQRELERVAG